MDKGIGGGRPEAQELRPKLSCTVDTDIPPGLVGEQLIVEGYVDGKIAHCLLDTGSQVTLICNSLFQKLGRTLCPMSDLILWHGGSGTMPYFGWTQVNIGLDVGFCGTNESFRTLALVVPDGRDSDRHQLVVGTNLGVLRNCYRVVFGENPCRKGQTEVHPTCAKIYRDFEFSRKIWPDGSIGVIKLSHRGILIVPASSMKTVAGTLRSRVRGTTTVLIDTTTPRKLPGGLEVVCSLVKVGTGFNRVSVCLMNPTGNSEGSTAARQVYFGRSLHTCLDE